MTEIPPVTFAIPEGTVCQEAPQLSLKTYIPCGRPAVAIVYEKRDDRCYYICKACMYHNVRNRDCYLIYYNLPGEVEGK